MFSRPVHVAAFVSGLHSFFRLSNLPLCGRTSLSYPQKWVFGLFLLSAPGNNAAVDVCVQIRPPFFQGPGPPPSHMWSPREVQVTSQFSYRASIQRGVMSPARISPDRALVPSFIQRNLLSRVGSPLIPKGSSLEGQV